MHMDFDERQAAIAEIRAEEEAEAAAEDAYGYDVYDEYMDYEPSPYDGTYSEC